MRSCHMELDAASTIAQQIGDDFRDRDGDDRDHQ